MVSIHAYDTTEERADDILAGLNWLDSLTPLLKHMEKTELKHFQGLYCKAEQTKKLSQTFISFFL
ncbi:MAG: hypothetical protein CML56_09180 [Rhodobacteraceae bacterium]|nr:hypothetical protein [Paracoccaceae bacterium]